ncbi:hypothetical protein [Siminovitchia sp. 179-K 8D1 HS]|uniref:hypothetical protein n=1 Tax=Siminovitchia sp. 179-K 8D1 HS TaxID=3142385 RepID=UPI0039A3F1B7
MTTVIDEKYTYDANGNRTEIVYNDGKKETYTYDHLNQLIRETKKGGSVNEYQYDGFGNGIFKSLAIRFRYVDL